MKYKTPPRARAYSREAYWARREAALGDRAAGLVAAQVGGIYLAHQDLWGRVRVADVEVCWPWTGRLSEKGYGVISVAEEDERVHRVVWEITRRKRLVAPWIVMHACDNPPCCNPRHLRRATLAENARDMYDKGREADRRGAGNGRAVLSAEQVLEIRGLAAAGKTKQEVAAAFGISASHAHNLMRGRFWKHLEEGQEKKSLD